MLRSQAQAQYSPDNIGHFGLGLARYAHFTSPIRRYADLLVHRALVSGLHLGEGGLPADCVAQFPDWGEHISVTERRAAQAEREAVDRHFGLFVTLADTGADGILPIGSLPEDYYVHDEIHHCLVGKRTRRTFQLGQTLQVVLHEANTLTGSMVFHLEGSEAAPPRHPAPGRRPAPSGRRRR